ncbi:MAG: DUF1080 domain-containing protein [Clostridia bacterium]|nr:DUF1080 domain-containing protein [Clostridia bacterium]
MKRIVSTLIAALMICLCFSGAIYAESSEAEPENGAVLYETDFSEGLPEGFRIPKGSENRIKVEDGFLYIDATGVEFAKVLLPAELDKYGNYEITIHATMLSPRDAGRWGSIMYRVQNASDKVYPYLHMCFRYDSNPANGVEFAIRNEQNAWNVTSTGSVEGHTFSDGTLDEIKATVRDDRAIHSINGVKGVDCTDAGLYEKGAIGLQANYSILKVDDVKVTYLRSNASSVTVQFTEIAQPTLGVIGGYTLSEYVESKTQLDGLASSQTPPANAIFRMNSSLRATDASGAAFAGINEIFTALDGKIMPTFYVNDEAAADAVCSYLDDNGITDVFMMSDRDDLVLRCRRNFDLCRGVLDLTDELKTKTALTDKELLKIRQRTNAAFASIVVIPDCVAQKENVKYLYDRLIAVWVSAPAPVTTLTQAFTVAASGGHGAVTDNTALMYKVINEYMTGNKLFRSPLNIGHRGIPQRAPENTVEGSMLAYELGADCVENDIYITKDGELMVMHDGTTGRTANGDLSMENSTSDALRELLVNKQNATKEGFTECRIPFLEDYFKAFKGKDIQIFVEIKSTSKKLVEKLWTLIGEYGVEDQVSVITFHASQINNLKEIYPEMSAGFLCNPLVSGDTANKQTRSVLNKIQKLGSTYNPSYSGHTAEFAAAANMRGITTWPWTIDDKNTYISFFMAGYNGLTTNNCTIPAKYVKTLETDAYNYDIKDDETVRITAFTTTYNRVRTDVTDDEQLRVIPIEGDIAVDGANLSFSGDGPFSFALEYTYKINNSNSYTIYTRPITVNVTFGELIEPDDSGTVTDTQTDAQTDAGTESGEGSGKSFPVAAVVIPAVVVAAAGVAVGVIVASKKKKG